MATDKAQPVRSLAVRLGLERDWYLVIVATFIGLLMGGVAMAFITPIHAVEHWAKHTADPILMMYLVPIAPAIGGLLTGLVLYLGKREAHGPGVATVMYAAYRDRGRLPLLLLPRKWLASTLTICSGGSTGAEAPIVTLGATIGSNVGRWLKANPQNTTTLLGCGAAAGLSAVFNAPFAGVFFVTEVILRDFSLRTFIPIVVASVIASGWRQTFLGENQALFGVGPEFFARGDLFTLIEVPNFLLLGLICGAFAPVFARLYGNTSSAFRRIRVPTFVKPGIGGAMLGLIGLAYILIARPENNLPPFFSNGYPVITEQFLNPHFYFEESITSSLKPVGGLLAFLLVVTALKTVGTCVTIGSGGSGGMFAPSLFVGAGLGGAFGVLVVDWHWFDSSNPAHYALVGMAAMLAALAHAPLTGILLVYEMTRSYDIILPLMFAAVIATVVARSVRRESLYTWEVARMGVRAGAFSDHTVLRRLYVSDVPLVEPVRVGIDDSAQRLLHLAEASQAEDFVACDAAGGYRGMVVGSDLRTAMLEREALPLLLVNEIARTDLPTVHPNDPLDVVLDRFSANDVHSLAVLESGGKAVLGMITRDRLMRRYQQALAED
jgi:CIC family chloride channel protein